MLVYAQRGGSDENEAIGRWLEALVNGDSAYGVADLVLSGFVRVVTHPRVFARPTSLADALAFVELIRDRPNRVEVRPGARHWDVLVRLCRETDARGSRVPGAYLAALAIESGSEWVTTDGGFGRFAGLSWRHPLRDGGRQA